LNGFIPDTTMPIGNGAGFKAGGFGSPPSNYPNPVPRHVVRQCIAFGNRSQGFYANHHNGGIDFFNNLAFRNPANYNMLADSGFPSNHTLRNNIAMASGTAISNLSGGTDTFNSWTSSLGVTVNAMDFLSVMESEAQAPRQADGSLPNVNFGRLAAGSDLIDKGTDVGLPFSGSAPDLGPFETGLTAGAGGMAGTGGSGMGGSGGNATGGVAGTSGGGAPGGAAGANTGGATGGAATGGVAGQSAGSSAGGAAGVATGGSTSTGGVATGGVATGGVSTGGSVSGSAGAGAASTTGGAPSTAGNGTTIDPDLAAAEDGGCGCRVGSGSPGGLAAMFASLLALAGLAVRRRRS
jgi:MYXO-CTERM domain-containing protein